MQKINFQNLPNQTTPISAQNLNAIQTNTENAIKEVTNVELLAVTNTPPTQCSIGDKYYNTNTKKIYTATDTNTWSITGEDPISGIFYIVFDEQSSYSWDGTDLVSVGGGKEDIVIGSTQPSGEDWKIYIDNTETVANTYYNDNGTTKKFAAFDTLPVGTEVDYDGSTVPSGWAEIPDPNTYSTDEVRIGTWIDGKPLYRKVIDFGSLPNASSKAVNHNINNLDIIVKLYGIASSSSNSIPLPYSSVEALNKSIQLARATTSTIRITTGSDRSSLTGYVVIEYTKTTD